MVIAAIEQTSERIVLIARYKAFTWITQHKQVDQ